MTGTSHSRLRRAGQFLTGSTRGRLLSLAIVTALATGTYMSLTAGDLRGAGGAAHQQTRYPSVAAASAAASSAPMFVNGASSKGGLELGGSSTTPIGDAQSLPGDTTGTTPQNTVGDQTLIVKTGSMSLEVTDINGSVDQAKVVIVGLGGYVAESHQSGYGDDLTASVTYRLPAARWDDALTAMRHLGKRVISEQTGTSDVTASVVDLNARIDNLKATESALQAIMARATLIADVLAVQNELTQVQGQIEELTAQRNYLADQAAMSTLSVSFQLPARTVVTQATRGWNLGDQVDQAVAQLIKVGQGLATVAVWAVVVGIPVALGLLLLIGILWLVARIFARPRRRREADSPAPSA